MPADATANFLIALGELIHSYTGGGLPEDVGSLIPDSQSTIGPLSMAELYPAGTVRPAINKIDGVFDIAKADDEAQILFGWASVAVTKDGEEVQDAHDDVIDIADLELAAYDFMFKSRMSGEDHMGDVNGVVVESMVFTEDKLDKLGIEKGTVPLGWFIGVHVPDKEAFERAKVEKQMFSIEGRAIREETE